MGKGVNVIGGPLLYEIFNFFILPYMFSYLENFICPAGVVKNFEEPI